MKTLRRRLAENYGSEVVFTATIGTRGMTKDGKQPTICLENIVYKGEKQDDHMWITGETWIAKGKRVCVTGTPVIYDNYSNYTVKDCILIPIKEQLAI